MYTVERMIKREITVSIFLLFKKRTRIKLYNSHPFVKAETCARGTF